MLRTFRTKTKLWSNIALWPVIIAFIAFYGWSFSGNQQGRSNAAAIVNEVSISHESLVKTREQITRYYRDVYKDNFERMAQNMDFQQIALEKLIDDVIIMQKADELGFVVSKDEIRDMIRNTAYFQKDGQFSPNVYNYVLRRMRMTSAEYEDSIRKDILLGKVRTIIQSVAPITESELRETYTDRNLKANCDYYAFAANDFMEDITIEESDRTKFYQDNPESFRIEDQIKVDYIRLDPKTFEEKVDLIDEDIEDYYNDNITQYKVQEQVQASHILLKVNPEASQEKWDQTLQKILSIKTQLDEGALFEEMAKQYSEDGTASNGGDLGYFQRGRMVKSFEDTAWNLEMNAISDPVKTQFGYHIIKKTGYKRSGYKLLDEIEDQIRGKLLLEESKRLTNEEAQRIFSQTDESTRLQEMAETYNLDVQSTDFFTAKAAPREIGHTAKLEDVLFNLELNVVSIPIETHRGTFLFAVTEKKPSHIPPYEEVATDQIDREVKKAKAGDLARTRTEELSAALKAGKTWEETGSEFKIDSQNTGDFTIAGYIPRLGSEPDVVKSLFDLNVGDISEVQQIRDRYIVFKLISKIEFSEADFQVELPKLRSQMLSTRQYQTLNSYLSIRKNQLEREGKLIINVQEKETA
jgi:peptidyl-prolyl cis-trans isomerase D